MRIIFNIISCSLHLNFITIRLDLYQTQSLQNSTHDLIKNLSSAAKIFISLQHPNHPAPLLKPYLIPIHHPLQNNDPSATPSTTLQLATSICHSQTVHLYNGFYSFHNCSIVSMGYTARASVMA